MGTQGTGKFPDYSGGEAGAARKKGKGAGARSSRTPGRDRCELEISGVALEEVASEEYFTNHRRVPRVGTQVDVRRTLVGSRIAVETSGGGEVVGYLPTEYNYLRQCMSRGFVYSGTVETSSSAPLPRVSVDLTPTK